MKTYIYLSKTKIEMLFGQVPRQRREKVSAELGFNLGVLAGKIASQIPDIELLSSRASIVSQVLTEEGLTGSLATDRPWVAADLICQSIRLPQNPNVFVLCSKTGEGVTLLVGSAANVVSGVPAPNPFLGFSYRPYIAEALKAALAEYESMQLVVSSSPPMTQALAGSDLGDIIYYASNLPRSEQMNVQLIARRLFSGQSQHCSKVHLLSPLYVALRE